VVSTLAQGFTAPEVGATVQRLLAAPFDFAGPIVKGSGDAQVAAGGRDLCAPVQQLFALFPFNPRSHTDATPEAVASVLEPAHGALAVFYQETGQKVLTREGAEYRPRPGAGADVNPAFVRFLNRATRASTALFQGGGSGPTVVFGVKPLRLEGVDSVTATIGDRSVAFVAGGGAQQFTWVPLEGAAARLTLHTGGGTLTIQDFEGAWAIFRLFQQADRWENSGSGYVVEYLPRTGSAGTPMKGTGDTPIRLAFELHIGGAEPIFRRDYFAGLNCPSLLAAR
jgi:type VI protein secretion system component VasK